MLLLKGCCMARRSGAGVGDGVGGHAPKGRQEPV